jgi:hypothetical protein
MLQIRIKNFDTGKKILLILFLLFAFLTLFFDFRVLGTRTSELGKVIVTKQWLTNLHLITS